MMSKMELIWKLSKRHDFHECHYSEWIDRYNRGGDSLRERFEDTPAVLFQGKPCEERCYFFEWTEGQTPKLSKTGKRVLCKCDKFVPIVVLGRSKKRDLQAQQKNQLESIKDLTPDEQKTTLASGDRLHALPELRRSRKSKRKQWFVCPFDVSALAEIQSKMQKGSHGVSCHRVDMGGTVGDQVVRLHTTKPVSARSTPGTWRSSGLRQLGLVGSYRTVPRQNPKSKGLPVKLCLLAPEQRDTTSADDAAVAKASGEAHPPGIAVHSS